MHACEVAVENGIGTVLVPQHPGHFSAIGMLMTNLRMDRTVAIGRLLDDIEWITFQALVSGEAQTLATELTRDVPAYQDRSPIFTYSLVMRYSGQEHGLVVADAANVGVELPADPEHRFHDLFEREYEQRYGHSVAGGRAEIVEVQIVAEYPLPQPALPKAELQNHPEETMTSYFGLDETPVTSKVRARRSLAVGETLAGPAIVYEEGATTVIPPGAVATVLSNGVLSVDLTDILRGA